MIFVRNAAMDSTFADKNMTTNRGRRQGDPQSVPRSASVFVIINALLFILQQVNNRLPIRLWFPVIWHSLQKG
jgi:hypothetical protein